MKTTRRFAAYVAFMVLLFAGLSVNKSEACTRVIYHGSDSLYIVGRSLDWKTPIPTNLYVYPRGMAKKGDNKPGAVEWISKYGAVYAVGYDGGITEGMNEVGLSVNGLFCKGAIYTNKNTEGRSPISLSMFVGWLLDMNATTREVIDVLQKHDFTIGGATFDGGTVSALHWGITDASGHSAIIEFDNGVIEIHDMGSYKAMTNDPQWKKMTAIVDYWNNVGGQNMMPGTVSSPDRCVRANYFAHHVKSVADSPTGLSITRSVLVNASVPYTYGIEGSPNLSSTQWRSYSNLRDRLYYFEFVTNLGIYYVDLKKCDLRPGAKVLRLDTSQSSEMVGDVTGKFVKSEPFVPMY